MNTTTRTGNRMFRYRGGTPPTRLTAGVSLVELLIGMVIGLVVAFGIFTMFNGVSRSNQLQSGLARLQENGRFAVTQIEKDLRMTSAQYCSTNGGMAHEDTARPMWSPRPLTVYAANLGLEDSGGMQSVTSSGQPATNPASSAYALSARYFMQGYNCETGDTCTPALPDTGMFPSASIAAGARVPNADILTVRYLRGTGWAMSSAPTNCVNDLELTLDPQPGDDPLDFEAGDLLMLAGCQGPGVVPISAVAGDVLTIGNVLPGLNPPKCGYKAGSDDRAFNFSNGFVTVTYYLAFRPDDNPDAIPNAAGESLVPTLIRRENGVEQELVRGVDDLRFRYGVLDRAGELRYLTAAEVDNRRGGAIECPPKPEGVAPDPTNPEAMEPGCLWRSVSRIEAHLLVNSESDVGALDPVSRSFRFMGDEYAPTATAELASGLIAGNKPRREFIAQVTARNSNP